MGKTTVLKCKQKLANRLSELRIFYVPETDPMPKVHQSKIPGDTTWVAVVGSLTVVISEERAKLALGMLSEYNTEVQAIRKRNYPPKVKGPDLVIESRTPFTDVQKEIDSGMGVVGSILAIVFGVLFCSVAYLLKHY